MPALKQSHEQIAKLQQHLQSVQASDKRTRKLIDRLPIGVFECTLEGSLLRANQFLADLLGYPDQDSLLAANINQLYYHHADILPQIMLTLQQSDRLENVDVRLYRYDGSLLWVSMNLILLKDEHNHYIVQGMVMDVSHRKKSERALQESEERYQSVVMALAEGVVVADEDDHIQTGNPRAQEILGLRFDEMRGGRPMDNLAIYREDGSLMPYEEFPSRVALTHGQPIYRFILQVQRRDGKRIWLSVNSQPLFRPGEKKPHGVVTSFHEITERMINQQQIYHQMQVLQTINTMATASAESENESAFLHQVRLWLSDLFPFSHIDLFVQDQDNNLYDTNQQLSQPTPESLASKVMQEGFEQKQTFTPVQETSPQPFYTDTQVQLAVPLKTDGVLLGVLNIESAAEDGISDNDQRMLDILARQIAAALLKIRLREEERNRIQQLETLVSISRAMRRAATTFDILEILINHIVEVMGASGIFLLLVEQEHLKVVWNHAFDFRLHAEEIPENPEDRYWDIMQNRQMTLMTYRDLSTEQSLNPVLREVLEHSRWSVAIPIKASDQILGLMHIAFNDNREQLLEPEKELLATIAEIAGISLQRAQITETLEQRVAQRTSSLELMYNIRRIAAQYLETEAMLAQSLQVIVKGMDAKAGAIYMVTEDKDQPNALTPTAIQGIDPQVQAALNKLEFNSQIPWQDWIFRNRQLIEVKDLLSRQHAPECIRQANLRHFVAMPMQRGEELLGVLVIISDHPAAYSSEEMDLLTTVAELIRDAIEIIRLRQQAEAGAVAQERTRLARELHDSVTQLLYSLNLHLHVVLKLFPDVEISNNLQKSLDEMPVILNQAIKETRNLIFELRPSAVEEEGLFYALTSRLETVEQRAEMKTSLRCDPGIQLPAPIADAIFRISIEALNNVIKHANADEVEVRIDTSSTHVHLDIEDNGQGIDFTAGSHTEGFGMRSMREQTHQLGGEFEVLSKQGKGTIVRVVIPLNRSAGTAHLTQHDNYPRYAGGEQEHSQPQ
jgi:PAS domain S-box-containing protein